jgi:hypothetical protein
MPISQETILLIYGDLVDLVEKIETLAGQASQPDLFTTPGQRRAAVYKSLAALNRAAKDVHRQAIAHLLADGPEYEVNPLTGRLDE